MVLTKEQNDMLTRVGPGTPMGELHRRYWQPIAVAQELTDENPTKFIRILGEDLVLWKDKSGNVGLIQDHCLHRGASMLYGRVEERGIACAYHGWLYDVQGNCLETPAEPADSKFYLTVKAKSYPVQKLCGLLWTYMGPLPAPCIPPYDFLTRPGRPRINVTEPVLDCNWLQCVENNVDPTHAPILHQDNENMKATPVNTTRGFIDDQPTWGFYHVPYGIMKQRNFANGETDEHAYVFPNILATGARYMVPVDDTHTWLVSIGVGGGGPRGRRAEAPDDGKEASVTYSHYKEPFGAVYPNAKYETRTIIQQDIMVWETQRPIADRTVERLASSDRCVLAMREMLFDSIAKVQRGEDPFGTIRDPNHPMIVTDDKDLNRTGGKTGTGRPYGLTTGTIEAQVGRSRGGPDAGN
jgi:5,5'-dehydrodivanillate O-demethylase oxygenase subunit